MAIGRGGAIRVKGVDAALKSLKKDVGRVRSAALAGLITGGMRMLGASQEYAPRDLSNLRASGFIIWKEKTGGKQANFKGDDASEMAQEHSNFVNREKARLPALMPEVEIGFSANYALIVHEDLDAQHNIGQAKYMEAGIAKEQNNAINDVRAAMGLALI